MSDVKCPFCQQELGRKNINDIMCSNEKCVSWKGNFYGSEDLWQELIRTRKALDVAVDALKRIKFRSEHSKYECCKVSGIIAQGTLDKITAEQKDVK